MEGRKVVVIEANEVPLRLVEDLAESGHAPFLGGMLHNGALMETSVRETVPRETVPRELYPSQTWASMNTGVSYNEHQIYWYGDSKPERYPMYWQIAARSGRSVGIVNTLHSSPLAQQCSDGDFRFVIPDCFSVDEETIPSRYRRFQRANIALTSANTRQVSGWRSGRAGGAIRSGLVDLARSVPELGLGLPTVLDLGRLMATVASGRGSRERLRSGQFLLQQDLFLSLLDRHRPDLAVFFTNHVAASMHRYWYAMYPDDFGIEYYETEWVDRYRDEIPYALGLLDRFLQRLNTWCVANDRTLVVAASMGQGPSTRLQSGVGHEAVVVDPMRFLAEIGVPGEVSILKSMAPQLTVVCENAAAAPGIAAAMADAQIGQVFWDVDRLDGIITLTYAIEVIDRETVRVRGARRPAKSMGVQVYEVDDHSSGRHTPHGLFGVSNSPSYKVPFDQQADYLDFAPAILAHLGVPAVQHHRLPQLQI